MKKYNYWIMNAKLNITFFAMVAGLITFIGLVIADNRFELDLGLYLAIIILWFVALMNFICMIIIKQYKIKNQSIPIVLLIMISITAMSVIIVFIFNLDKESGHFPYQISYNWKDKTKNNKQKQR
ncbi:MAG: hypothetical protein Q7I99_05490 [Acholeplasmataceae bacterium]|nr:hypothetical protein [Acholeplasmataceae bacterium]